MTDTSVPDDPFGDDDISPEEAAVLAELGEFTAPQPRSEARRGRPKGSRTRAKPKPKAAAAPAIAVDEQITMLYMFSADMFLQNLPATQGAVKHQAKAAGDAWDAVLRQYPSLYAMIERGMIFGPWVALIMVHMPIIQTARTEMEERARFLEAQGGEDAAAA